MGILLLSIILNLVAWNSEGFCDWYTQYVFPIWVNTYGRLTGLFSFSVGEVMIIVFSMYLMLAVILLLPSLVLKKIKAKKTEKLVGIIGHFYKIGIIAIIPIFFVMTMNCFILYHRSTMEVVNCISQDDYTVYELLELRNYIVKNANHIALEMPRDQQGNVIYQGDMEEQALVSMKQLGSTYELLSGYYPKTKTITNSFLLSQQYIQGYYFPFSLETNINGLMYVMNKPFTMCHELSHIKGYLYEDEANFIGFLACIQSEDIYFQYSGYLGILPYVNNQLFEELEYHPELKLSVTNINSFVCNDSMFLTEEAWEEVEESAIIRSDIVEQITDDMMETTLVMNGVEDGMESYSRVVELLLVYYYGIIY